jgi:hypothetical protein
LLLAKQSLDEAPYINCPKLSVSQSASPSVVLSALLLIDIPWFLTEGKLAAIFIKTFSWGFPTGRSFNFTVPTVETLARMYIKDPSYVDKNHNEVRATPIENIVAAKELLENNQSLVALETTVKLMTKSLVQQEKATSSRRLESDVALCRSSTTSKARGSWCSP